MRVHPERFFRFCLGHVPLLRSLAERPGELSEAEVYRVIQANPSREGEAVETAWRNLTELQILIPTEPGGDLFIVADPIHRLMAYLFDEAHATTPEIVRGYILSLETNHSQLGRAIDAEDIASVQLALEDIQRTLRRIRADVEETHRCVLSEVSLFKAERRGVTVKQKFRRIRHWMDSYVAPMVEIVKVEGELRAVFDHVQLQVERAREHGLFNDLPALERITQHLRMVQRHALRVFTQCRKELQPLYDALRRSSSLAEGAALALHRLQRDGMDPWIDEHKIPVSFMRWQNVPSEQAINRTLDNVADAEPTTAPQIRLSDEQIVPEDYLKFQRLRELAGELRDAAPVEDLIGWVLRRHENSTTSETLSGVTQLMFGSEFTVRFAGDMEPRTYVTVDGTLEAYPLTAVLK